MFYSEQILARRGPLGLVWLAAHMHQQLKRSQVARLRLELAVEALLHPETPLALRLSGQLLLGLVRLYSKQVGYLQQDCQEALLQLQLAFHAAMGQPNAQGAHMLPADLPALPAPGGAAQQQDPATTWGAMVDLAEAQLLHLHANPILPRAVMLLPDGGGQRLLMRGAEEGIGPGGATAWREALLPLQALPAGPAAALLRRPANSSASRLLGNDADTATQPRGVARMTRSSLKQQQQQQQAKEAVEEQENDDDVRPARDQQRDRRGAVSGGAGAGGVVGLTPGKQWPASRATSGSQAESLFAAVASSVIASASQQGGKPHPRRAARAGSVSVGMLPVVGGVAPLGGLAVGGVMQPLLHNENAPLPYEEDEVFAPDAGATGAEMFDLLGLPADDIEVEVARDAGPAARLQPRSTAHLLAPLQDALGDAGGVGPWAGGANTPSTGRASKRLSGAGAGQEWAGPGSHQGSRAGVLATLQRPRLLRREEGEVPSGGRAGSGSGLMDMDLDLQAAVADDLLLRPANLGLGLGHDDDMDMGVGLGEGMGGDTPAAQQELQGVEEGGGPVGAEGGVAAAEQVPAGQEQAEEVAVERVQAPSARRASARLQQQPPPQPPPVQQQQPAEQHLARGVPGPALLPPLPPGAPSNRVGAARKPGAVRQGRQAGGQVLPAGGEGAGGAGARERVRGEGLQLRKFQAAQLMDGAGAGRGRNDLTVLKPNELRTMLADTSSLQVQRGLTALRQQRLAKRPRPDAPLAEQLLGSGGGGAAAAAGGMLPPPGVGRWPTLPAAGWGADAQQVLERCLQAPPLAPSPAQPQAPSPQLSAGAAWAPLQLPSPGGGSDGQPPAAPAPADQAPPAGATPQGAVPALPEADVHMGPSPLQAVPAGSDGGGVGGAAGSGPAGLLPSPSPAAASRQAAPGDEEAAPTPAQQPLAREQGIDQAPAGDIPPAPAAQGGGHRGLEAVAEEGPEEEEEAFNDENQAPGLLPSPLPAAGVLGEQRTPLGAQPSNANTPARSSRVLRSAGKQQQQQSGPAGSVGGGSVQKALSGAVAGTPAAAVAQQEGAQQAVSAAAAGVAAGTPQAGQQHTQQSPMPLSGGGGWGDNMPGGPGSSGLTGGITPGGARAARLGSLPLSQQLQGTGSQTTRSLTQQGGTQHLERRAVHTLQAVTRLKAHALPQELQTQLAEYASQAEGGSQLLWLLERQRSLSASLGDSPAASRAQGQGATQRGGETQGTEGAGAVMLTSSQQLLASQDLVAGLLGTEAVHMSQLLQDRAPSGGAGAAGTVKRLEACRCFYDLLVLQQGGLVKLSPSQEQLGEAIAAPQLELSVQLTQAGLEACVLGSA